MDVKRVYSWNIIYQCVDSKQAYLLEKVLYKNNISSKIIEKLDENKNENIMYEIHVPYVYDEISKIIIENALNNNLEKGIIYESEPIKPEDRVVIDHSYEVRIPRKYFWLVMAITLAPMLFVLVSNHF